MTYFEHPFLSPSQGVVQLSESQWDAEIVLSLESNKRVSGDEEVILRLDNTTGGATLADGDKREVRFILVAVKDADSVAFPWGLTFGSLFGVLLCLLVLYCGVRWLKKKSPDK